METFKANFIIIVFVILVLGLGYWALGGIKASNVSIIEGSGLSDVGPVVTSDPGVPVTIDSSPVPPASTQVNEPTTPDPEPTPTPTPSNDNKNAVLIDKLQGLIDDKILMKKGSRGTRVGTVQQFLKLYGLSVSVDNDYGDTTVTAVKKFQVEQKLPADGQSGEGTYKKMIEWLEKN
jgi:hypothetical protein